MLVELLSDLLIEIFLDQSFASELLPILTGGRLMCFSDVFIHRWLSEFRLIHLIMTILPVADQIQHYILFEAGFVLDGQLYSSIHVFQAV